MFEITVTDLEMAKIKMVNGPTCIVSLLDEPRAVEKQGDHHLIVEVSDVVKEMVVIGQSTAAVVPGTEHLKIVLDHTKNLTDDDKVLVHCFAGQSRSTAMAIAICIQHGMHWKEAFHHIEVVRPIMMPNQKIIMIIDQYFGLNGELIEYHKEWLVDVLKKNRIKAANGFTEVERANAAQMRKFISDSSQ